MVGPCDAGAQLNLVGYRADCSGGEEPIQMGRLEVGNANRPHLTGLDQFLERLPSGDVLVALRQRPVDQEQINVVQAKLAQALVETSNGTLVSLKLTIQLGRDEHLLAAYAAIPKS